MGGQADFLASACILLTVAPLILFPGFRRRIQDEFGRLGGTGRPSFGRVLIAVPVVVMAIVGAVVIPFDQPRIGPPFSLSALLGSLLFLWIWSRTGRIGRYHLFAAIASALAVVIFSRPVVGSLFPGYDGRFSGPEAAVFVWTLLLFLVARLDGRLLLELREIVDPNVPTATKARGPAPDPIDTLRRRWNAASAPPEER
jgi:hypothetical protein